MENLITGLFQFALGIASAYVVIHGLNFGTWIQQKNLPRSQKLIAYFCYYSFFTAGALVGMVLVIITSMRVIPPDPIYDIIWRESFYETAASALGTYYSILAIILYLKYRGASFLKNIRTET